MRQVILNGKLVTVDDNDQSSGSFLWDATNPLGASSPMPLGQDPFASATGDAAVQPGVVFGLHGTPRSNDPGAAAPAAAGASGSGSDKAVAAPGGDGSNPGASGSGSDKAAAAFGGKDPGLPSPHTSAGLHINLIADANNVNAPAGWAAAVRQAADIIEQNFSDPVTINLRYGYASFRNSVDSSLIGSSGAYANTDNGTSVDYTTSTGWLLGDRTTTDDFNSYNALPNNSSSFPDNGPYYVANAQLRALGQLGNNGTIDGSAAFGTAITLSNLVPVAIHELTHAMGRITLHYAPDPVIADWFRFDGVGHFQWTEGSSSASPSYFSIDNGNTDLADFGRTSDYSDFLNSGVQGGVDPFNEFYSNSTLHSLTTVDIRELDVIGFNRVDDFVQNPTTTGTVAVNGAATGNINPAGEQDWFRVTLTAGTHYRFNENGSPSGGGTNTDTLLALFSSATNQVAGGAPSGDDSYTVNSDAPTFVTDSQFFFTPGSSGTYYVAAGGFGSHTGTYTVHVTIDEFASDVTTTGAVSVGGSAAGNIQVSGDRDWFRTTLTAGQWYEFDLQGSPTGHGTLADTFLDLRNSAGTVITSDDDGGIGLESQIKFQATASGTYYLAARGFSTNTGTYTLSAAAIPAPPTFNALAVAVDSGVSGDTFTAGGAGVAGDTITLLDGATAVGTTVVAGDGTWSLTTSSSLGSGSHTISATQANANGTSVPSVTMQATVTLGTPNTVSLVGTAGADSLGGGAGADTLNGGAGADVMTGGAGNDSYNVDNAADQVIEAVGGGNDTVLTTVNYTLAAGQEIETLTNNAGATGLTLTGNEFNNTIKGGGGADTLIGGNGDDTLKGGGGADALIGGAGSDTATYSNLGVGVAINVNLSTGVGLFGDAAGDTYSSIENLFGTTANDVFTGDNSNNTIDGNDGNDTIDGFIGDDTLIGGNGVDTLSYALDRPATVSLAIVGPQNTGDSGTDTISGFENLVGSYFNDTLTGDANNNVINGGGGSDNLSGGDGNDTLIAGTPNVYVDKPGSLHNSSLATAVNVFGSFGLQSAAFIQNSTTTPHATVVATSSGDGEFYQFIAGAGSSGHFDIDQTSVGQDTFLKLFDANGNLLASDDDGGHDPGSANAFDSDFTFNFTTTNFYYIEVLHFGGGPTIAGSTYTLTISLTGSPIAPATTGSTLNGGNGNDILTGNTGDDTLNGDTGDDTLSGGAGNDTLNGGDGNDTLNGGTGADIMSGGAGNDIYTVDNAADQVLESVGGGTDRVNSSVSYALAAGQEVETLMTTNSAGVTVINLTGNEFNNTITGNAGVNVINGGAGNDTLNGLGGADTVNGGDGNDRIVDTDFVNFDVYDGGAGVDTIDYSGVTFANGIVSIDLGAQQTTVSGGNTESITGFENVLGSQGGELLIAGDNGVNGLFGNGGDDTINGLGGIDTIRGGTGNDTIDGGLGNDNLFGDTGLDSFRFDTALGTTNVDRIFDFTAIDDKILLDNAVFTAVGGLGVLAAGAFNTGTAATQADDRIIYDTATGALRYDSDGTGSAAAIQFATLTTHPVINNTHFIVV